MLIFSASCSVMDRSRRPQLAQRSMPNLPASRFVSFPTRRSNGLYSGHRNSSLPEKSENQGPKVIVQESGFSAPNSLAPGRWSLTPCDPGHKIPKTFTLILVTLIGDGCHRFLG